MTFEEFCESTGLHGWKYIGSVRTKERYIWLLIVIGALCVAAFFLFMAAKDFTSSTVVTTIETTTAPLSEVFFPTIILCSINQIRQSLFKSVGVSDSSQVRLLLQTFYSGMNRALTEEEISTIQSIATRPETVLKLQKHWHLISNTNTTDWSSPSNQNLESLKRFSEENEAFINTFDFIRDLAVEEPGDSPVLSASYGSKVLHMNTTSFLPFFGTDFGLCSVIKPQIAFSPDEEISNMPWDLKMFGGLEIKKGAKVGKSNGLSMLLDAETYDYMFQVKASEGFKMSVQHHLDQPLMQINEIDISPGFESQVSVTPTLYTTSPAAKARFSPIERGCYSDEEISFEFLPHGMYRYDIGNCLFEAAYQEVLTTCGCTPYFHWGNVQLDFILQKRPFCKAESLVCMNRVLQAIGSYKMINTSDPNRPGEKMSVPCLAACEDQTNDVQISYSVMPNRETLVRRPEFCLVVNKLRRSCGGFKAEGLSRQYPGLCSKILTTQNICREQTMKTSHLLLTDSAGHDLIQAVFSYCKDNLALVNVYMKKPVVTRIRRDQKIPMIWFIANSGGILGLCMGFSIVTLFEVLHYICVGTSKKIEENAKKCKSYFVTEDELVN